jgi:hypothetical protein
LLRHLDRDRLEGLQERRAAERLLTRDVAADHLRFVAHADLAHLDPGAEFAASSRTSSRNDAAAAVSKRATVERLLDLRQLHPGPRSHFQRGDAERFRLPMLMFEAMTMSSRWRADDPGRHVTGGPPLLVQLRNRSHDGAHGCAGVGLHDHAIAGQRTRLIAEQKRLRAADRRQLDGDERRARKVAHGSHLYL